MEGDIIYGRTLGIESTDSPFIFFHTIYRMNTVTIERQVSRFWCGSCATLASLVE